MNFAPSEATRAGDGLQAGDADAHDEHARGGHRAGRRHHHRQRALERGSRIHHRLIAGEVRLRRQHVHALRAADARHQLHGEQRDTRLGQRVEALGIGERVEHADQRRALFHLVGEVRARPPYREHDIGA
jgi:hypothetical protein